MEMAENSGSICCLGRSLNVVQSQKTAGTWYFKGV
jgi:hypothetical protein